MLPLTMGVVTTLLLFNGWLRTERGTVIRAGNLPCDDVKSLKKNNKHRTMLRKPVKLQLISIFIS